MLLLLLTLSKVTQVQLLAFFWEFFSRGGKIYCYANFYCYAIVFGPNFREGQEFSGGANCLGGAPPPGGRKPDCLNLIPDGHKEVINGYFEIFDNFPACQKTCFDSFVKILLRRC